MRPGGYSSIESRGRDWFEGVALSIGLIVLR